MPMNWGAIVAGHKVRENIGMLYHVGTHINLKQDGGGGERKRARGLYFPGTRVLLVNAVHDLAVLKITRPTLALAT